MTIKNDDPKPQLVSKKWLYISLAVIALILGFFLDNEATAAATNSSLDTVEQVDIDNGKAQINTDIENGDPESNDVSTTENNDTED